MRIQNGDVELNVVVDGADDAPPILLLHGILGGSQTWDWIVTRLVDNYRLLRLDFRGHGKSGRAPAPTSRSTMSRTPWRCASRSQGRRAS
jgi:pimeloyl-ACP methyl ester carboxylesterase